MATTPKKEERPAAKASPKPKPKAKTKGRAQTDDKPDSEDPIAKAAKVKTLYLRTVAQAQQLEDNVNSLEAFVGMGSRLYN